MQKVFNSPGNFDTLSEQRAKNDSVVTVELLPNGIGEEAVGSKQFLGHCCSESTELRGEIYLCAPQIII